MATIPIRKMARSKYHRCRPGVGAAAGIRSDLGQHIHGPKELERNHPHATFVASAPQSADGEDADSTSTRRLGSFGTYLAARTRVFESTTSTLRQDRCALALVIVLAIGLAVVPEVITHLNVKHSPDLPPLEDDSGASKFPLAHLASLAGSALLLLLSSVIAIRRGNPNRVITGALILLLAVNLPYPPALHPLRWVIW